MPRCLKRPSLANTTTEIVKHIFPLCELNYFFFALNAKKQAEYFTGCDIFTLSSVRHGVCAPLATDFGSFSSFIPLVFAL